MHFLPILSTLRRHRTAATLVVLEIALTCAIVCNTVFLVSGRLSRMDRPSGVPEDELVRVLLTGASKAGADATAVTAQDLAALRAIPGVTSAAATNQVPFGGSSWNNTVSTIPDDPAPPFDATVYMAGPGLVKTLGAQLIAGRDFTPEEYLDFEAMNRDHTTMASVIITRAMAERLFPGKTALGQPLYAWSKEPQTIIGVIDRLARPNDRGNAQANEYSVVLPASMSYAAGGNYVLRVDPGRRAEVLAAVDATLNKVDPGRIILERQTFGEIRRGFFKQDRAMAWLLVGVSIALLVITALGIIGLASFWVQQRTRQIGIRRALGATRSDIIRYFQTENFILSTAGIVLGMALAYAINQLLMGTYQVERLPAVFLPLGAVLLWLLGQIAVLGPALRASMISPATATRTL
jgi:putative ABC transport system permease protein